MTETPAVRMRRIRAAAAEMDVVLQPGTVHALLRYLDAMLAQNEQVNLTAIRDRAAAEVLHVLDSIALARCELAWSDAVDLGSGNGFPAVAVHLLGRAANPTARTTCVERTGKKCRAIGAALAAAEIEGIDVRNVDATQWPTLDASVRERFDLVTARALAAPAEVARLARPLLSRRGSLVLWLEADAQPPAVLPGALHRVGWEPYELPEPAPRERRLAIYERVS